MSRFRRGNYYCFRICIYNWRPRFKTKCSEINQKRYLGILALLGSIVVAFSRVYLFAHYPTDVLTGLVLGIIVGFIAWKLARIGWNWWTNRHNDVEYEPYTFKRK
ncbi:MAG: phosphatase PAP2 family protein [Veillonella sp.]|nr:phosphatase PAP2 family protein [Veillonella sp.]